MIARNKGAGGEAIAITKGGANAALRANSVTLVVKVSNVVDIANYAFVFSGTGVAMNHATGEGTFKADRNGRLDWVMWGEPEGSMTVEVKRGAEAIASKGSDIPSDASSGHDSLDLDIA